MDTQGQKLQNKTGHKAMKADTATLISNKKNKCINLSETLLSYKCNNIGE